MNLKGHQKDGFYYFSTCKPTPIDPLHYTTPQLPAVNDDWKSLKNRRYLRKSDRKIKYSSRCHVPVRQNGYQVHSITCEMFWNIIFSSGATNGMWSNCNTKILHNFDEKTNRKTAEKKLRYLRENHKINMRQNLTDLKKIRKTR